MGVSRMGYGVVKQKCTHALVDSLFPLVFIIGVMNMGVGEKVVGAISFLFTHVQGR